MRIAARARATKAQIAGAAIGGAAGVALGAAAIPVVGPIAVAAGLAVGAYTGSFAGAVNKLGDKPPALEIPARPAGVRLAAHVLSPAHREHVIAAFQRHDVRSIEEAEGIWRDGSWADFDPVSVPKWLRRAAAAASPDGARRYQNGREPRPFLHEARLFRARVDFSSASGARSGNRAPARPRPRPADARAHSRSRRCGKLAADFCANTCVFSAAQSTPRGCAVGHLVDRVVNVGARAVERGCGLFGRAVDGLVRAVGDIRRRGSSGCEAWSIVFEAVMTVLLLER